jgi:hypothetical protein
VRIFNQYLSLTYYSPSGRMLIQARGKGGREPDSVGVLVLNTPPASQGLRSMVTRRALKCAWQEGDD